MAQRFKYLMNFGSGLTEIDIYENNLEYVIERTVSEFTSKPKLEGTFTMLNSDFTNLNDIIETDEVLPFRIQEDTNLGGAANWITRFDGEAHLRGKVDWTKGFVEVFGFTDTSSKLIEFLQLWDIEQSFIRTVDDYDVIITNGTTPYQYDNVLAYFFDGMLELFTWIGISELTMAKKSLTFANPDYLMIFPSLRYKGSSYTGYGSERKITVQRMLKWLEYIFQIYWYIDETVSTAPKMLFYSPDDTAIASLILDGTYTNCVDTDLGKTVTDDSVGVGTLIDYDNTNQIWWIRMIWADSILDNSTIAITSGTGAGTASGDSDNSYFPTNPILNVVSNVTNIIRDSYKDTDMVWLEIFNFANEFDDTDFTGYPIKYPNQTEKKVNYDLKDITTNVWGAADNANSGIEPDTNGFSLCWCTETATNEFTTVTGTGLISSTTISNEFLSKANLHYDFFQTNRYHIRSGVYINDTLETLADDATEKHIRDYPDYQEYSDELPTSIGILQWEFNSPDYKESLVMRCSTNLRTSITTYKSRQLKSWLT